MGNDVQATKRRERDARTRILAAVADLSRQVSVVALRRNDPDRLDLLVGLVPTDDGWESSPWATYRLDVQAFTARSSVDAQRPIRTSPPPHPRVPGLI